MTINAIRINGATIPTYPVLVTETGVTDTRHPYGDVRRHGAVGDGTSDDTAAVQNAVASAGPSGRVVLPLGLVYRCASVLTFDQAGQTIVGGGATLLFDGPNTSRLLNITASDVTCDGVIFDGNGKQPAIALVAVADNAARPQFPGCSFQHCTGTATNTNALNLMYGLMISPYGVTDFDVRDCTFADLLKHNDTATVTTPTAGWGFCGGIFFYNGAEPTAPQTVPSSGVIDNCDFENIRTILDVGLTENEHIEFDDADGIRFYGILGGATQFPVEVSNCRFRQVSKRAVKQSGGGTTLGIIMGNLSIDATGLPYPMVSLVKLDNESITRNVKGRAGTSGNRVISAVEINGHASVLLDGVQCDFAGNGIQFSTVGAVAVDDVAVKNATFPDCSVNGFVQSTTPASQRRVRLEDSSFTCTGTNSTGLSTLRATDTSSGAVLRNVRVKNGIVFVDGDGSEIDGLTLEITNGTYDGPSASRSLLTLGLDKGLGAAQQNWRNITIDARGIATTWNTANRCVAFLYGDRQRVAGLRVLVPTTMGAGSGDFFVAGDDLVWDGFEYSGPGFVSIAAAVGSVVGGIFRNSARLGASTANNAFFIINSSATTNVSFEGITEEVTSSQSVVRIVAGGTFAVRNVLTKSTASPLVDRTAATACDWSNVKVFGLLTPITIASATAVTLVDGAESFQISGTTAITSIVASGWEGHTIKLIFLGALTLTDGSNLKLAGNFVTTADDTITLLCAGGNWYECGRSVN